MDYENSEKHWPQKGANGPARRSRNRSAAHETHETHERGGNMKNPSFFVCFVCFVGRFVRGEKFCRLERIFTNSSTARHSRNRTQPRITRITRIGTKRTNSSYPRASESSVVKNLRKNARFSPKVVQEAFEPFAPFRGYPFVFYSPVSPVSRRQDWQPFSL